MEGYVVPTQTKKLSPVLNKILLDFGGKLAVNIAKLLINSEDMLSTEQLVEQLKVEPKDTRKVLYILRDAGLLRTRSIPDPKTRFLDFYWENQFDVLEDFIKERKFDVKYKLESRLDYESQNYFFICSKGCKERISYADAIELNFICPACQNNPLVADPNQNIIDFLKKTIKDL